MSRRKHSDTNAWWLVPDEYLGRPTKVVLHERSGITFSAQTPDELVLLVAKQDALEVAR